MQTAIAAVSKGLFSFGLPALWAARPDQPAIPAPHDVAVEPVLDPVRIAQGGRSVVDTTAALRVVGAGQLPVYFVPARDVDMNRLHISERTGQSDWGGRIACFHLIGPDGLIPDAVWFLPEPAPGLEALHLHLAFCPQSMDEIRVGDARVDRCAAGRAGGWSLPEAVGVARLAMAG